jgi:aspartate-semialdehyde dehydrogenase
MIILDSVPARSAYRAALRGTTTKRRTGHPVPAQRPAPPRGERWHSAEKAIDSGDGAALSCHGFSPRSGSADADAAGDERFRRVSMGFKVAVVGATGNVGREMLNILAERRFPADEVVALASRKSMGVEVSYGDKILKCKALEQFDFSAVDICLMSAGSAVSKEWSPKIGAQGAVVIDNSSQWRMDPDVPLVVPEVNAAALDGFRKKNIIANPNCSTAQLVVALKPLHDKARITRVVVSTYQSVSGAGKDGMDELDRQTKAIYSLQDAETKKFPKRIAFNVIPHIDVFMEDGYTKEEWKMMAETKKILDPKIRLSATCVRVPVFIGHSEAVNIEFEDPISVEEARQVLRNAPGCIVIDKHEPGGYVTPLECVGEDETYISRIRTDPTVDNGLVLWVVSDNLRKGAALNAIQIAEVLISRKLIQAKRKAA